MRPFLRFATFTILLIGLSGCGQKGAKLQKSVVPPDKTLFETGTEYLNKSQYIKARLAFQTLINTYPDSELAADTYLAIGDSFYTEGGTENLLQAEDQYKNFIIFFPTHPKGADAQMKIVSLRMKMMRSPDRDQTHSVAALRAISEMLEKFPDSDYIPIARQFKTEVEENLAQADLAVGAFYADKKRNYLGAKSRFKEIVERYPNFSQMDETLFRLADALEKQNNPEEASIYLQKIAAGFPNSKYYEDARSKLDKLGKPVPPVDNQMVAQYQPLTKASGGFSPLRPFISFAEAIGFKGPPDRYLTAKKMVEAKKIETAEAQAGKASENARPGEGVLITATLTKDASGKTTESAVVGANANATPAASDKNEDKKKNASKTAKKKNNNKKPS